jgi:hypothetical protein
MRPGSFFLVATTMTQQQNIFACPACGGANLHHNEVTVYDRKEDAVEVRETKVIMGGAVTSLMVPSKASRNPSGRRGGIAIGFWCETCPALFEFTISQHKGTTYTAWRLAGFAMKESDVIAPEGDDNVNGS